MADTVWRVLLIRDRLPAVLLASKPTRAEAVKVWRRCAEPKAGELLTVVGLRSYDTAGAADRWKRTGLVLGEYAHPEYRKWAKEDIGWQIDLDG